MSDLPYFQIVHEAEFDEQLFALICDPEAADEFVEGAKETLARRPDAGMPVSPLAKIWYMPMAPVKGRRVSIFYTFDEEKVTLLWIVAYDD